uniref:DOCKER domain-containing protein n=1 Tax=Macrostomum lignano TaxID=282301 RepID=A0A1I8FH94_9PLAT
PVHRHLSGSLLHLRQECGGCAGEAACSGGIGYLFVSPCSAPIVRGKIREKQGIPAASSSDLLAHDCAVALCALMQDAAGGQGHGSAAAQRFERDISEQHRQSGNAHFKSSKASSRVADKRRHLWSALDCYKLGLETATSARDRGLCRKNSGVAHKELCLAEWTNQQRSRAWDHLHSSLACFSEAWRQATLWTKSAAARGERWRQRFVQQFPKTCWTCTALVDNLARVCNVIGRYSFSNTEYLEVVAVILVAFIELRNRYCNHPVGFSGQEALTTALRNSYIAKMPFPIQEAERVSYELETLREDQRIQEARVPQQEIWCEREQRDAQMTDEALLAMDHLRAALNLISEDGIDIVLEAEICSDIGSLYLNVFNAENSAEKFFKRCIQLILCHLTGEHEISDGTLADIKTNYDRGIEHFLEHIYKVYSIGDNKLPDADLPLRKRLMVALSHYHPDKADKQDRRQYYLPPRMQGHSLEQAVSDGMPLSLRARRSPPRWAVSGAPASHSRQSTYRRVWVWGLTRLKRALQGEQQDILNGLGAVASARITCSPVEVAADAGWWTGVGLGPDALSSARKAARSSPEYAESNCRSSVVVSVHSRTVSTTACHSRALWRSGSALDWNGPDRTEGSPASPLRHRRSSSTWDTKTAEIGEPLTACELGRLPVCTVACQVRCDVGRHSQHLGLQRVDNQRPTLDAISRPACRSGAGRLQRRGQEGEALFAVTGSATDVSAQREEARRQPREVRSEASSQQQHEEERYVEQVRQAASAVTTAARVSRRLAAAGPGSKDEVDTAMTSMTPAECEICVTVPRCGRNSFCRYGFSTGLQTIEQQLVKELRCAGHHRDPVVVFFPRCPCLLQDRHNVRDGPLGGHRSAGPARVYDACDLRGHTAEPSGPSALPPDVFPSEQHNVLRAATQARSPMRMRRRSRGNSFLRSIWGVAGQGSAPTRVFCAPSESGRPVHNCAALSQSGPAAVMDLMASSTAAGMLLRSRLEGAQTRLQRRPWDGFLRSCSMFEPRLPDGWVALQTGSDFCAGPHLRDSRRDEGAARIDGFTRCPTEPMLYRSIELVLEPQVAEQKFDGLTGEPAKAMVSQLGTAKGNQGQGTGCFADTRSSLSSRSSSASVLAFSASRDKGRALDLRGTAFRSPSTASVSRFGTFFQLPSQEESKKATITSLSGCGCIRAEKPDAAGVQAQVDPQSVASTTNAVHALAEGAVRISTPTPPRPRSSADFKHWMDT